MNNTKYKYPTDLSDKEWEMIKDFIPASKNGGRPRKMDTRAILNAIFYLNRTGCPWRYLPKEYPAWQTVYGYFRTWKNDNVIENINACLVEKYRLSQQKEANPSVGIIDTQSAKTTEYPSKRGYDAGKKINGKKRHIIVDSNGLVLKACVHPANTQDRDGAKLLVDDKLKGKNPRMQVVFADSGYSGKLVSWFMLFCSWTLTIVKRPRNNKCKPNNSTQIYLFEELFQYQLNNTAKKGFILLPWRWIVERTFAWLCRNRRLSKDYEGSDKTSEAFIYLAMIRLILRRFDRMKNF